MQIDTSIFKAYDIRGIYPTNITPELAYKLGQAYATYIKPQGEVVVGNDVRIHSEELKNKLAEGLVDSGVNVVDIGLVSTDMLYFAVGHFGYAGGIQSSASHNPPEFHGFKMIREKVIPTSLEDGISQMRDLIEKDNFEKTTQKGTIRKLNIEDDYISYILSWIDAKKIKKFKVVINANFGYAGVVFKKVVEAGNLPIEVIGLNDNPDGTFPKGRPDPFVPENRAEFSELVKNSEADLGIAWDADADRVFFCANGGEFLEPYFLNTLLIKQMLKKFPNEKIIYDPRYTWALVDAIKENGGIPVICKVGHSYIKAKMRQENALYATESSGHTYFRDFWYADNGMIPAMQILELLSESEEKLSDLIKPVVSKYFMSGEINNVVSDKQTKMDEIAQKYKDGKQDTLDGISVEYSDYRFNVRPSNTESLLRLNLEAKSKELMEQKRDEVLAMIRK
ncbi:MAG TPA: phosphomannomutase/phosphoglucomutase [Alphaproteobacteria bacterium]|jgi:phosphomannomutase|nr:phosphomannomutase/phosphoglucomutase [Alphaproteobacteria bacterium]